MKKITQKTLSVLLVVVILMGLVPIGSFIGIKNGISLNAAAVYDDKIAANVKNACISNIYKSDYVNKMMFYYLTTNSRVHN